MTPVVLIHGVGLDQHMWASFAAALGRPALTYDLLGLGDAPKPPGPYSLDRYARQLVEVADGRRVDVVGFSLGALIAQRAAIDHPHVVRRLVLVSGVFNRSAQERSAIAARVDDVRSGGYAASVEPALDRWFTSEFTTLNPQVVDAVRSRMRANDPVPYSHAYAVFAQGDAELAEQVHRIAAPTLVVTGGDDERSTPTMARLLAAEIPNAQVHILEGLKHLLPLEAPAELARAVNAFLDHSEGTS